MHVHKPQSECSLLLFMFFTRSIYEVWGYGRNLRDVKNRVCQYPENKIVKCQALMKANFFSVSLFQKGYYWVQMHFRNIFSSLNWIWYYILHAGLNKELKAKLLWFAFASYGSVSVLYTYDVMLFFLCGLDHGFICLFFIDTCRNSTPQVIQHSKSQLNLSIKSYLLLSRENWLM